MTAQHPKTSDDVERIVNDNVGNQLLEAVVECAAIEGRAQVASSFAFLFGQSTQGHWRGPRAMLQSELRKKMFTDGSPWKGKWDVRGPSYDSTARALAKTLYGSNVAAIKQQAVVQSVAANGPAMTVVFKKETISVEDKDCQRWHIINFQIDGTPIWDYKCGPSTYHTEVKDPTSVVVTTLGAGLLQPGYLIETIAAPAKDAAQLATAGFPTKVWADKGAKKLVAYFGVPLQ